MQLRVHARLRNLSCVALTTAIAACASQNPTFNPRTSGQDTSLAAVVSEGDRARSGGDLTSAENLYKEATAVNSRSIEGWLRLAAVQVLRGEVLAAMQSYRAVQALDPANAQAAYALGQLALRRGSPADAVEEIQAGLRGHPDDSQLNYLAWTAYTRLGQFEVAQQYYRIALLQDPSGHVLRRPNADVEEKAASMPSKAPPGLKTEADIPAIVAAIHPTSKPSELPDDEPSTRHIYRLQLGSERSQAMAHEKWEGLKRQYPQLLSDVPLTVDKADLGARGIFYRVQAGSTPDARQAQERCAELMQRGAECLVVRSY